MSASAGPTARGSADEQAATTQTASAVGRSRGVRANLQAMLIRRLLRLLRFPSPTICRASSEVSTMNSGFSTGPECPERTTSARLQPDHHGSCALASPSGDASRKRQENVSTCDYDSGLSVDDLELADLAERFIRPLRIEPDRRLDRGFQQDDLGPTIRHTIDRQSSEDRSRVARSQRSSHPVPIGRTTVRRHLDQRDCRGRCGGVRRRHPNGRFRSNPGAIGGGPWPRHINAVGCKGPR